MPDDIDIILVMRWMLFELCRELLENPNLPVILTERIAEIDKSQARCMDYLQSQFRLIISPKELVLATINTAESNLMARQNLQRWLEKCLMIRKLLVSWKEMGNQSIGTEFRMLAKLFGCLATLSIDTLRTLRCNHLSQIIHQHSYAKY